MTKKKIRVRTELDVKDIAVRAFKTFVQGALAAWAVTGNATTKEAAVGALAAGISAVMNLVLQARR